MTRLLRYRPSPAMVVACISLFVALGGVGYAATKIGSGQIKNNSIRTQDIRNRTIRGKDVRGNTLTAKQIKDPERYHEVGSGGQPPFQNGAVNFANTKPGGDFSRAGFLKDNEGFVHLRGTVRVTTPSPSGQAVIFTLPRGYRPAHILDVATIASSTTAFVYVHPNGDVEVGGVVGQADYALDSITFRAGA